MLSPSAQARNSASPPESGSHGVKRKRKTYSCDACRRRKLKCDRGVPSCTRCKKAGQGQSCFYDIPPYPDQTSKLAAPASAATRTPTYAGSSHHTQIAPLKAAPPTQFPSLQADKNNGTWQLLGEIAQMAPNHPQRPAVKADNDGSATEPSQDSFQRVIFRGENFKTQYYGGSNPVSLIGHFPELRLFMKEAINHQKSLYRTQHGLKDLQKKWKVEKNNTLSTPQLDLAYLFPKREMMDNLVHLYFDTFENIYRILHRPSFWKEYADFIEDRASARPAFVMTVLLLMACTSCITRKENVRYIGDSSLGRERATLWIEAAESWLRHHSQKNVYLAVWQVRCLLILAKQVNSIKKKKFWTEAGTLIREAMAAGFHRDPSILGDKVSDFDREMRRRLWGTMIELELQASIDRGMASTSSGLSTDTKTALNIEDEDLSDEIDNESQAKPANEYTQTSFLHLSGRSFQLRASLNSIVNDLKVPVKYEEVLEYEEMIMQELKKLPPWTKDQPPNGAGLSLAARTLLDVQLRQFLIMLHSPFARQPERTSRHSLSRMVCFDAAANILDQYRRLNESGNYALLLIRHDYFRSGLIICQNAYISLSLQNDLLLSSSIPAFADYIDQALGMLEDRITQLGTGYTHYWYISAGCALLRSASSPDTSTVENQQAIDRVARQYYRILASQEDIHIAKEKVINLPAGQDKTQHGSSTNTLPVVGAFDNPFPEINPMFDDADLSLDEVFFGDPQVWTFDSLYPLETF